MTSSITLNCNCRLGEGLFVSDGLVSWIDITSQEIFIYRDGELRTYVLPIEATVILDRLDDLILLGSATGFGTFDLSSGGCSPYWTFDSVLQPSTHRSNDGCHLQRGGYLIGAMHRVAPDSNRGAIYHIDDEGIPTELDAAIHIPNSFVEIDDGSVLVSDSKLGIIYRYCISNLPEVVGKTIWYAAEDGIAPDGGCRLPNGNIAIAMWDAACIREFDQFGSLGPQ